MSEPHSRKKHKKKSFLYKVSRAFGGRKRSKTRGDSSSDSDDHDDHDKTSGSDNASASRSETPRASPLKMTSSGEDKRATAVGGFDESRGHLSKGPESIDKDQMSSTSANLNLSAEGADRNLESKKAFLAAKAEEVLGEILAGKTEEIEEIEATDRMIRKERRHLRKEMTDSDESDTTESNGFDDESIGSDYGVHFKEVYFTTGKFITYFFLEMERQNYNPQEEVYSYIHYRPEVERARKGRKFRRNILVF